MCPKKENPVDFSVKCVFCSKKLAIFEKLKIQKKKREKKETAA
jgi:hypothetical protein